MIVRRYILSIALFLCCVLSNAQHQEPFWFALLTDLHVTHKGTALEDLENSVQQINLSPRVEFVLVTGDITEEGDYESLAKAKTALDKLNVKYYIVPGNHETKWSESGATDFDKIFGNSNFSFEHKGYLFLGFNSGPLMRMADGHVAPQDIIWLENNLKKAGKNKPVFIATHYPMQQKDVDNWYEVIDAVYPYRICSFLGGHYHKNLLLDYDGIPGVLCRSNLRAKEALGGYSLFEVTNDSIHIFENKIKGKPEKWNSVCINRKSTDTSTERIQYPDFSVNQFYPEVDAKWLLKTGVGIYASPIVNDKRVFIGDDLGYLTAYRLKDGKKQWSYKAGNRIVGTPAIEDGIIVFGSADHAIYGVKARNGKRLWKVNTNGAVLGAATISQGIAYIGGSDGEFRAINIHTGKVIWTYTGIKGYIETKPLIEGNAVIFGAWDNTLYALNKITGKEIWKWKGEKERMHYSPAAVWPLAAHDKVFITDPERAMTAIDMNTGKTVWRTYQSKVRETMGMSEDKSRIYSKTMNDSIVCFATEGDTPKQLWASNVGFGYEHAPSMQIEKEGVMIGSTKNGLIFALHPLTGGIIWKHKVGNSLINTVDVLPHQEIVFTTSGGIVGLLKYKK